MRKRPICDPRHYGRHLHKLRQLKPPPPKQPTKTQSEHQPKKRSLTSPHPTTNHSNLLNLPILPNLYDPSLPIDQTYPNNNSSYEPTPPRKPLPLDPQQEAISFPPSDYDGQFTFRLEMHHVCQRLLGLHLAISTDKKNRAVQIQEAMRIAMERLDPPPAAPDMANTNSSSMGLHNQNDHHQNRLGEETFDSMSRQVVGGRDIPHPTDQKASPEHRRRARRSSSSTTAHGPSGPPPSEPPPPLPQPPAPKPQELAPAGKPQVPDSSGADGRSVQQGARKNKKKGKKKRSAHANANNIHHRDNYVPSRLPASYPVRTASETTAFLGGGTSEWARLRLEYESRTGRGYIDPTATGLDEQPGGLGGPLKAHCQLGPSPIARFFVEPDEWICSFCEYELWFGDPLGLVRVIKNRKDVLRRRRRAKERAARAASGIPPSSTPSHHPPASNAAPLPPPPPATAAASNEPNKIKKSKNNIPSTLPQASPLPHPPPPAPRRRLLNDHDIDDRRAPLLPPPLSSRTCRPNRSEKSPPDRLPHQPSSTPSAS